MRLHLVTFPVRVHLVSTDDEIHEIVGVHRDVPFEELQQIIYDGFKMKGELLGMKLDARWMSDADWKFICDSTRPNFLGTGGNEDNSSTSEAVVGLALILADRKESIIRSLFTPLFDVMAHLQSSHMVALKTYLMKKRVKEGTRRHQRQVQRNPDSQLGRETDTRPSCLSIAHMSLTC